MARDKEENIDFLLVVQKRPTNNPYTGYADHVMTVDMARKRLTAHVITKMDYKQKKLTKAGTWVSGELG